MEICPQLSVPVTLEGTKAQMISSGSATSTLKIKGQVARGIVRDKNLPSQTVYVRGNALIYSCKRYPKWVEGWLGRVGSDTRSNSFIAI